ncbi:hypothetical protein [Chryseobacterium polytrichastri]|uniref:Nitrogen regulatory IIA protein n=1 Tax=Chryseobacterium polytrichastri TaxID=1302687 RepID=A0A1M7DJL8_9FLAO|nr:hypothetical protein [Chryseobacterium polytrichastri]SHL79716.1 hypothetical protein SAMN05444267_102520 [Chryseobacterium polytrichastri]
MKKLRIFLHTCETRLEKRWKKLSAKEQKKWVILFFAGYLLLTGGVVLTVWYDAKMDSSQHKPVMGHIRNPMIEQEKPLKDSLLTPIKNNDHEK